MTADDVVFSLNRFKDPKVNNLLPFLATSIASVVGAEPEDRRDEAEAPRRRDPGEPLGVPGLDHAEGGRDEDGRQGVRAEPGRERAVRRQRLEARPVPEDGPQPALLARRASRTSTASSSDYITNDNTRILSLQSGQVDVAESIPFSQVDSLNKGSTRVEVAPLASIDAIWLNNTHKPFDDKLVRQALNYATDKDAINRVVYFGHAEVANGIFPFFKYTDKAVKNYPYDMDKAKALLAKSSAPKGFDVTILIPSEDQTKAQMMAVVKQLWSKLGVNVTIQSMETNALFTKYMNGDYEASDPLPSITADVLVPDELALAWLDPKGVQKGFWSFYKSQKAWDLTLAANSTTDEAKRKKVFGQIQRLTLDDAPWVPLFFVPARTGLGSKVQNFHTLESGWWNLWEVWKS